MSQPDSLRFEFREEHSFRQDREQLVAEGVTEQEIDSHLLAIQDSIGPDPFAEPWSRPVPNNPGLRSAVSSATEAEPNVIRISFRVEGHVISQVRLRRRD